MYKNRRFIAIIPARKGSKGLPDKNIKNLCGKPLIAWSVEAGKKSEYLDELMVTTDGAEIAEIAERVGARVPFIRPEELATDSSTTVDVVIHALRYYKEKLNQVFDYVVLLEPTSPLRENYDIDLMIEKIISCEEQFDSIISIGEVHEHPSIMKNINDNLLKPYNEKLPLTLRRQDNPPAYFPYGVAYITKTETIFSEGTFYPELTTWYKLKRYQNYEIDDIYDFLAVENIMKHERGFA